MKTILIWIAFLALAACSSNNESTCPGCGLPELTAEQKVKVQQTNSQFNSVNAGALKQGEIGRTDESSTVFSRLQSKLANQGLDNESQASSYEEEMEKAFNQGLCTVSVEGFPENGELGENEEGINVPESINFELEVANQKSKDCPFYAKLAFGMKTQGTASEQAMNVSAQLSLSNEYRAKAWSKEFSGMDIQSYNQTFTGGFTLNGNQATGLTASFNGQGTATIETKESLAGTVKVSHNMTGQLAMGAETLNANMQFVTDYQFADFRAVGVIQGTVVRNPNPPAPNETNYEPVITTTTYLINGRSASEKEYMEFFSNILAEGMGEETQNQIFQNLF